MKIKQYKNSDVFVSEDGEVFVKLNQMDSGYKNNYKSVSIDGKYGNGYIRGRTYVHRLVAETFIDNKFNKPEVNHINNNHKDNRVENLEWVTRKENAIHHMGRKGCNFDKYIESRKKASRKVINSKGEIFNSITEGALEYGVHSSNITMCCRGRNSHAGGVAWKYLDETGDAPNTPEIYPNGFSKHTYNNAIETGKRIVELQKIKSDIEIRKDLMLTTNKFYNYIRLYRLTIEDR